jgi:hypothetical protein
VVAETSLERLRLEPAHRPRLIPLATGRPTGFVFRVTESAGPWPITGRLDNTTATDRPRRPVTLAAVACRRRDVAGRRLLRLLLDPSSWDKLRASPLLRPRSLLRQLRNHRRLLLLRRPLPSRRSLQVCAMNWIS